MGVGIWMKERMYLCAIICVFVEVGGREEGNVCIAKHVCARVCACKSKFEREGACVFACASFGGTLFHYTMHSFDIPAPPVSVYKGLSPGFDMCESAAGQQR